MGVTFSCPKCNIALQFKSELSNGIVCPNCQVIVRRVHLETTTLPRIEPVQEDLSIIRIGTTGGYQDLTFEVIGRLQYFFQERYRNHWFLQYSNGTTGWLGDWGGNYSLFINITEPRNTFDKPSPGKRIQIKDIEYFLEQIDVSYQVLGEGELPVFYLNNDKFITLEFYNHSGGLALAHVFTKDQIEAFTGHYVEVSELKLQHFRDHHDWA